MSFFAPFQLHSDCRLKKEGAMRGIKPENVPRFVGQDVALVMREAQYVISIDTECVTGVVHNPNGGLLVIAVIGPGFLRGDVVCSQRVFRQALLLEVGIWRGRPYRKAFVSKDRPSITYRRQWFSLTQEQWSYVAPILSNLLAERVQQQTATWLAGTHQKPFFIRGGRRRRINGRTVSETRAVFPIVSGLRVSVPLSPGTPSLVLDDFWWSDFEWWRERVELFSRYIDKALNRRTISFAAKEVSKSRIPTYLLARMIEARANDLAADHRSRIRWMELENYVREWLSQEMPHSGQNTNPPGARHRLREIETRFLRSNHHYAVFEVYAPPLSA